MRHFLRSVHGSRLSDLSSYCISVRWEILFCNHFSTHFFHFLILFVYAVRADQYHYDIFLSNSLLYISFCDVIFVLPATAFHSPFSWLGQAFVYSGLRLILRGIEHANFHITIRTNHFAQEPSRSRYFSRFPLLARALFSGTHTNVRYRYCTLRA